jgi:hypothetical protein
MSGSVGGVQYRKTSRGNVVCLYRNKPLTVSAPQAVVRACMTTITALYHTLDAVQLSAWRTYGAAFDFRWGSFAYFTYCNLPLARAGSPLLSWPPGTPWAWVSRYPPSQNSTYVKATSTYGFYYPYSATDPTKSLVGAGSGNSWASANGTFSNQRFHIDIGGYGEIIERIYYENFHISGGSLTLGVKGFILQGSNSNTDFQDLVYADAGTWQDLTTVPTAMVKHVALDQADPHYVDVINTTVFRFYALKCVDNYGATSNLGFRRVELQIKQYSP